MSNTNYGYYKYSKYTHCYDNENTYKDRDEFSKSFLRRWERLNEMNTEGDREFMDDCLDYGEYCGDNYGC